MIDIYDKIREIKSNITSLKSTQKIGSESTNVFVSQTDNEHDFEWTKTTGQGNSYFNVLFTPDNQPVSFASLSIKVWVNNVTYNPATATFSPVDFSEASGVNLVNIKPNLSYWGVFVGTYAPSGVNIKVKVKVTSTDTGRVEIVRGV